MELKKNEKQSTIASTDWICWEFDMCGECHVQLYNYLLIPNAGYESLVFGLSSNMLMGIKEQPFAKGLSITILGSTKSNQCLALTFHLNHPEMNLCKMTRLRRKEKLSNISKSPFTK